MPLFSATHLTIINFRMRSQVPYHLYVPATNIIHIIVEQKRGSSLSHHHHYPTHTLIGLSFFLSFFLSVCVCLLFKFWPNWFFRCTEKSFSVKLTTNVCSHEQGNVRRSFISSSSSEVELVCAQLGGTWSRPIHPSIHPPMFALPSSSRT